MRRRTTTKNKKTEEAATKTAATRVMAVFAIALSAASMGASAQTWRCGNSYSDQPCEGGQTVKVDDRRSDADRKASEDAARRNERSAGRLARSRQSLEREAVGQRGPTTFDAGRFTTNAQPLTPAEKAAQARQRKHTTEPRPTSARFNSPSTGDEAPKEAGKKKKKKKPSGSDG
ncbi:hypothetical protein [Variovorax sp. 38R]|uniref:hypothetical protein n=1 Tax=Variovorax sp. 38R TaxID=2774875 RepID=UPI001783C02C|nr:hypothetical protein [Variovorax sp. 38R]QOF77651.1 hypothetical protein IG196_25450 [Variovorax sp. 38R]